MFDNGVTELLNISHVDFGSLRSLVMIVLDVSGTSSAHQVDGTIKLDGWHSKSSLSHRPQRGDFSSHFV